MDCIKNVFYCGGECAEELECQAKGNDTKVDNGVAVPASSSGSIWFQ